MSKFKVQLENNQGRTWYVVVEADFPDVAEDLAYAEDPNADGVGPEGAVEVRK